MFKPVTANLYRLGQVELWGDYGDVLVSGFINKDEGSGHLALHRGGPFTPPVFFPWSSVYGHALIVNDLFRKELERAPFGPLGFRAAIKDRIVPLPFEWQRWNREADMPQEVPDEGEPENYIWDGAHSPTVAAQMPEFWEVLPPLLPCKIERESSRSLDAPAWHFTAQGAEYQGLFRDRETWFYFVVDQPTRQWFEERVGEWVSFVPLIEK